MDASSTTTTFTLTAGALFDILFTIDVQIGTVGYILTLRPLDAHIRSGNPFLEISKLDDAALTRLGADYLDAARPFRKTDRPHFVDKLPANWLNVGLIRLILPNATRAAGDRLARQ